MLVDKVSLLILSILFISQLSGNVFARQTNEVQSVILEGSKLRINGTSNVNDFECIYQDRISSDTLHQTITFGDSLFISGDSIHLNASSFDCGKKVITRDLKKTLKADEFPFIQLELVSIEIKDELPLDVLLSLTIAGVNKKRKAKITEFSSTNKSIHFLGNGSILLSDFNLSPPSALFGLVKVDDEVEISFDLTIEQ